MKEKGFKGDHHFYISFNSKFPGVKIPPELINNVEENEVKIILQHQFWNLTVDNFKFSVTLSFNGKKKNIIVPFDSIFSFSDPSVGFSLQFKKEVQKGDLKSNSKINKIEKNKKLKNKAEILSLDAFRAKKND